MMTHNLLTRKSPRPQHLLPLLLLLLFTSCTHAPGILDYVSLPPPDNVQAKTTGSQVEITWEFPQMPSAHQITGFNVYLSAESLVYTALSDLPAPTLQATRDKTCILLPIPKKLRTILIHVRSKNKHGDVSLPSLPEVMLEITENK
ncbi:MAG: hypothetical protein ACE5I1_17900 [bacterium]